MMVTHRVLRKENAFDQKDMTNFTGQGRVHMKEPPHLMS